MMERSFANKGPLPWLPTGLISWYASGGVPLVLMTSWLALLGGDRSRIRTAWHGRHDPASRAWAGGDFVMNVPNKKELGNIRDFRSLGKLCLKLDADSGLATAPGLAAVAPRLLDCAVQIECIHGRLVDVGYDVELCGDVACVHRDERMINADGNPDFYKILSLKPMPDA